MLHAEKVVKRWLLRLATLTLAISLWLVWASQTAIHSYGDVPGFQKELAKTKERFKNAKVLSQADLSALHNGTDWNCTSLSNNREDFQKMDLSAFYKFSTNSSNSPTAATRIKNSGASPIRSFTLTDRGLEGTLGMQHISVLRLDANGDLIGETSFWGGKDRESIITVPDHLNVSTQHRSSVKASLASTDSYVDPVRRALSYVVCKKPPTKSISASSISAVKK